MLFAANHPNSFLDGMILTTLLDNSLYSLARGDAFKKNRINRLLRALKLLPVYRTSEGIKNLGHNYTTFDACRETFKKNGLVLIFSEGGCENEWHLRPLKKGTARLSITSWKQGIPLTVLPAGINYSSFQKYGKEVHLLFGQPIERDEVMSEVTEGKQLLYFNEQLQRELQGLVYEIDPHNLQLIRKIFPISRGLWILFLAIPGLAGWILHAPLYYLCKIASAFYRNSGHYDSVLTSLLVLFYPVYLLVLVVLTYPFLAALSFLILPLLPITAWACTQVKYHLEL